jgi:hypothetical protein
MQIIMIIIIRYNLGSPTSFPHTISSSMPFVTLIFTSKVSFTSSANAVSRSSTSLLDASPPLSFEQQHAISMITSTTHSVKNSKSLFPHLLSSSFHGTRAALVSALTTLS